MLQDDPSFLPEFTLPPPELLAELNLGPAIEPLRNGDSQSLSPFGSQQHPTTPEVPIGGLVLPTSSSVDVGEFLIHGDNGSGAVGGPSGMMGSEYLDDPGFGFDDDGNLIDFEESNFISGTPAAPGGTTMPSDDGASARVRQEHEEGLQAGALVSFTRGQHLFYHLSPHSPSHARYAVISLLLSSSIRHLTTPLFASRSSSRYI
jgi:meiotic recombination protein REC8